jgi:hypothetical protein
MEIVKLIMEFFNMKFKKVKKPVDKFRYKTVLVEEPSEMTYDKKAKMRKSVNDLVFDAYDSIADNAKMISLLFALLSRIYESLPDNVKSQIADDEREIIEYAFNRYHAIQTRADVEFEVNGIELINKLMDRQAKIGKLYKQIYLEGKG